MAEKPGLASGVYLIMERGDKALFLLRKGTDYLCGMHMLPGGGVEPGEPPTIATIRETREEVAVGVAAANLAIAHVMFRGAHDSTGDRVDIFFRCTEWDDEPVVNEPHKCDGLNWLQLDNLPESVPPYVRSAIKLSRQGVLYSEFDWN